MSGYFTLGIVGYKVWGDIILPILVAAVCAAVGATIQHFVKKYWAKKEGRLPKFRQNGKH